MANRIINAVKRNFVPIVAGAALLMGGHYLGSRNQSSKYDAALQALTESNKALTAKVLQYEAANLGLQNQLTLYSGEFSNATNQLAQTRQKLASHIYSQTPNANPAPRTAKTPKPQITRASLTQPAHKTSISAPVPYEPVSPAPIATSTPVKYEAAPRRFSSATSAPSVRHYSNVQQLTFDDKLTDDNGILRSKEYMARREAKMNKSSSVQSAQYQTPKQAQTQVPSEKPTVHTAGTIAPVVQPKPASSSKGNLVNIQQLSLDDEFRAEKYAGTYDSIQSRIKKRALNEDGTTRETLTQREQRQDAARMVQVKEGWSNPWTPIVNYVDYADRDSGTNLTERLRILKTSGTDFRDHATSAITFSYFNFGDKNSKAAIDNSLITTNDFRYGLITKDLKLSLEEEVKRLSGEGLSGEPVSDGLDYILRGFLNQPIEIGLSAGDEVTLGLLRNTAVPAMHLPGDAADLVKNGAKTALFGPAIDMKAPEGIYQCKNGLFRFLNAIVHYAAKVVGGKNGGVNNSENPVEAAQVRGLPGAPNHAGANAEKLGAAAFIGYTINKAVEDNPPSNPNKVTGGEIGGPGGGLIGGEGAGAGGF